MSEHPFQLFPVLDAATESALRFSIERFGVLVPVAKDQHGRTLDGYHRSRIADDLGVTYRVDVISVADDDEALEIARTLNADRRMLTVEQRREVVAALRGEGHSTRAIAGALGVGDGTVRNDLSAGAQGCAPDSERVTGLDGKSYPAKRAQSDVYYGKGDKWREATKPLSRYLAAWEKRGYEFRHLNPREAGKRLRVIDDLIARLTEARTDLGQRSHRAKLTV